MDKPGKFKSVETSPEENLRAVNKWLAEFCRWAFSEGLQNQPMNKRWELLIDTGGEDMKKLVIQGKVNTRHVESLVAVTGAPNGMERRIVNADNWAPGLEKIRQSITSGNSLFNKIPRSGLSLSGQSGYQPSTTRQSAYQPSTNIVSVGIPPLLTASDHKTKVVSGKVEGPRIPTKTVSMPKLESSAPQVSTKQSPSPQAQRIVKISQPKKNQLGTTPGEKKTVQTTASMRTGVSETLATNVERHHCGGANMTTQATPMIQPIVFTYDKIISLLLKEHKKLTPSKAQDYILEVWESNKRKLKGLSIQDIVQKVGSCIQRDSSSSTGSQK